MASNGHDSARRVALRSAATLGIGTLAGCAATGATGSAPKTPFTVADTYIPIAGSDLQFPVRRIYCIGRNYPAHAREMGVDGVLCVPGDEFLRQMNPEQGVAGPF